jgi:methylglutaconyl-CoA hydratase
MMTETVLVTTDERGVATLELNRPDKHNALSEVMFGALCEAFARLAADPAVRVVVLTGRGGSFCAGGDLTWFLQSLEKTTASCWRRSMPCPSR